jgi:phosphoribosylamine---glycine ligase
MARTVAEAQSRAYAAVAKIGWPEGFCRRDVGWRAIEKSALTRPSD